MTVVRMYRMTISTTWYDKEAEHAREYEMHYKVARRGRIRSIRRNLAKRCIPHFQQNAYRRRKQWVPKREVRVSFEREQPTVLDKSEKLISIESREMQYRGKQWKAYREKSRVLTYVKKRHKRKSQ